MSEVATRGLVLVGHGSRLAGFEESMEQAAAALREQNRFARVACAYLEINEPSIPQAIDLLAGEGLKEIFVLPYFLLKGRHTQEDIPKIVAQARAKHAANAAVRLCPFLGYDDALVDVILKRIGDAS